MYPPVLYCYSKYIIFTFSSIIQRIVALGNLL
nr:MAG TPA: hypothetical protein [Caudoviricetes sp.]